MKPPFMLFLGALVLLRTSVHAQLSEAVDAPSLFWNTGGSAGWVAQNITTHDGVDAAQSGFVFDAQESWLQTTVTGPGTLTFWWKVSSEADFDFLRFQVNGVLHGQISGEVNWQQLSVTLPPGNQTLRWRYVKDPNTSGGQDRAWVDQVSFIPASGAPQIAIQPSNQTVWEGANVTLGAVAVGGTPLAQRWIFNSNAIDGATSHSLTLSNVTSAQAGQYRLVASNAFGSVTSAPALVSLTSPDAVTQALLFVDTIGLSPFESALANIGIPFQRFTDEFSFNAAVNAASPLSTLVIVDQPQNNHSFGSFSAFISGGGRMVIEANTLASDPVLCGLLKVAMESRSSVALPLYSWGGTPFFTGATSPLGRTEIGFDEDSQKFHVLAGGVPVAGFVDAPTPGDAAVVIGNDGRTIVNGFWVAGITPISSAVRFAESEILFLTGPVSITLPLIRLHPRNQVASVGAPVSFDVIAWGGEPLTYEWQKDGVAIPGATGSTYTIASAQTNDIGGYSVAVSNAYGGVVSTEATLSVSLVPVLSSVLLFQDSPGPPWYKHYETALNNEGLAYQLFTTDFEFSAAVASANPSTTLVVIDAINYTYDFSSVVNFIAAGGRVLIAYWNLAGSPGLAAALGVSVVQTLYLPPPVYNWSGSSFFDGLASPLNFTDLANIDGQALQPFASAQAVAGFTFGVLPNQAAVVIANNGRTIVNGFLLGQASSSTAAVRFAQNELVFLAPVPPRITAQPQNARVAVGGNTTFSVTASGSRPFSYQWRLNGTNIPLATNATYTIVSALTNHAGTYTVVVSNPISSIESSGAVLDVGFRPTVVNQPQSQVVRLGTTASVSVSASGTLPFNYRWLRNGTTFTNFFSMHSSTSALTFDSVQFADAASYRAVVTNIYGPSASSATAFLQVVQPPTNYSAEIGETVLMPAKVAGGSTPSFRWQFNGMEIPGATSTNLVLTNVQANRAGRYTFTVTNAGGTGNAFDALLTVREPDTDGDGIPDDWEMAHGLDHTSAADADLDTDGDGLKNRDEYIAGTNPTNSASVLRFERIISEPTMTLEFTAMSNKTYTILFTDRVPTTNWTRAVDVPGRSSNRLEVITNLPAAGPGYYRIITPRQP